MSWLDDQQAELALARPAAAANIPMEVIRAQRTAAAAFSLACSASGLEDKEIYLSLKQPDGKPVDAGYFSNIKKGKATLQADLTAQFCRVVGNTIYPEWIASQVGCTLVMVKTEAERRAEAAELRAAEAERENKLMRQLLAGKVAA